MGIETALLAAGISASTAATISTVLTVASTASTIIGGIQQRGAASAAAKATSREAQRQADLRQQEREIQARSEARENIELEKRQKLAFIKSGVSLEGSPLLLLAETRRRGTENVEALLRSGRTEATGLLAEGALRSRQLKASGRQALIGGLTTGAARAAPLFQTKK